MSVGRKIRVGVVGVGHLGKVHAKLWKEVEHAELIGVYDENKDAAIAVAIEHSVTAFDDLFDLIDSVDAISIVTPTFAHYAVARDAIERNKHILIEKPITN